jgi:S1-C subfamily serine protease
VLASFLLATVLWTAGAKPASALEPKEIAERAKPSVVLLKAKLASGESAGTGFFVEGGRIVTNEHVIHGATGVEGSIGSRKIKVTGILAADSEMDIAVLAVDPAEGDVPALSLGTITGMREGDPITVIGHPLGLSVTLTQGFVSAVRAEGVSEVDPDRGGKNWQVQFSAEIAPGSSGSPVLDADAHVVAVAVGHLAGREMYFGVPVDAAKKILEHLAPGQAPQGFEVVHKRTGLYNLGISAGVFGVPWALYVVWSRVRRRSRRGEQGEPLARQRAR